MKTRTILKWAGAATLGAMLLAPGKMHAQQWSGPGSAFSIPHEALVQPAELDRLLRGPKAERPLVLQVGSHVLFEEAHIAGAEYAGPGSQETGLAALRERVQGLARGTPIVIYCGCCPWNHCPNIAPAYRQLQEMGFVHVRALLLAENFGTDWMNKGYPVAHGR